MPGATDITPSAYGEGFNSPSTNRTEFTSPRQSKHELTISAEHKLAAYFAAFQAVQYVGGTLQQCTQDAALRVALPVEPMQAVPVSLLCEGGTTSIAEQLCNIKQGSGWCLTCA